MRDYFFYCVNFTIYGILVNEIMVWFMVIVQNTCGTCIIYMGWRHRCHICVLVFSGAHDEREGA